MLEFCEQNNRIPHFTDEETAVQKGQVYCSHSSIQKVSDSTQALLLCSQDFGLLYSVIICDKQLLLYSMWSNFLVVSLNHYCVPSQAGFTY